jgi:hypothetical protein
MIKKFFIKHEFAVKWIGLAFFIKGSLFFLFSYLFYQNWPKENICNFLFISASDTSGYYSPVESFVNTGNYDSFCRMPGLLPIYGPLYYLFGAAWGKTLVVVFQFICSTLSVYFLAQTAARIFKSQQIFYACFFLYALSTFVSNWDHYGLSDSFAITFLVYSFYFAVKFKENKNIRFLFLSGFFIAWSIFFRPVHGILSPVLVLIYLTNPYSFKQTVKNTFFFIIPLVFSLLIWSFSNYSKYKKIVILQGSFSECFNAYTPEMLAVRSLIISWGGDYQPWSKGSEAEWFFGKNGDYEQNAIGKKYLTERYNYDSLLLLRTEYRQFVSDSTPVELKNQLGLRIKQKSADYVKFYKTQNTFSYYFFNKLRVLQQLILPKRLDDFPTPAFASMHLFHKLLKGLYFLLFLFVSLTGFLWCFFLLYKKQFYTLLPLTILFLIAGVLGYVEQRYMSPAYPFLVINSSAFIIWSKEKLFPKRAGI